MGRMRRRSIPLGAALATVIVLLAFSSVWFHHTTDSVTSGPMDFYHFSRDVSLSELVQVADKWDVMPLYLPSALPPGFQLTAIYLMEGPFVVIVIYSAEGNKDFKTAELGIEIVPAGMVPTYEQLQTWAERPEAKASMPQALVINSWPVMIHERASTGGHEERRAKYGDYSLVVTTWIEGNEYLIGAPTLTPDRVIQLVRSMRPIS